MAKSVPTNSESSQSLVYVDKSRRQQIRLARLDNLRRRAISEREREEEVGPAACRHCGSQPCGHMWPVDKCCSKCTHSSPDGWEHTHTIVCDGHTFDVWGVWLAPDAVRAFVRADGVIQWLEMLTESGRPTVAFLGRGDAHMPRLYPAGVDTTNEDATSEWDRALPLELSEIPQEL